jgi:hypothetical protein
MLRWISCLSGVEAALCACSLPSWTEGALAGVECRGLGRLPRRAEAGWTGISSSTPLATGFEGLGTGCSDEESRNSCVGMFVSGCLSVLGLESATGIAADCTTDGSRTLSVGCTALIGPNTSGSDVRIGPLISIRASATRVSGTKTLLASPSTALFLPLRSTRFDNGSSESDSTNARLVPCTVVLIGRDVDASSSSTWFLGSLVCRDEVASGRASSGDLYDQLGFPK